jgi:hypothetical protein
MEIVDNQESVRTVIGRYSRQYPANFKMRDGKYSADVIKRLSELDLNVATAADVAAIIGNTSWVTKPSCQECGGDDVKIVKFGDYDGSNDFLVCEHCLVDALGLIRGETP